MKPLSDYKNDQLTLVQPSIWKRVYELRTPDIVLMTITYPKWFSTKMIIEGFNGRWEVYKQQWWRGTLEIRNSGEHLSFAKYIPKRFGLSGTFELPQGGRLHYVSKFLRVTNEIHSEHGQCLVNFKRKLSLKPTMDVTITEQSQLVDKYPWVLMVVYRILMERNHQATH